MQKLVQVDEKDGRDILRNKLLEKFQKAYGNEIKQHKEIIDYMIGQFFKENEKISETNLFDLKSRVKEALSRRSQDDNPKSSILKQANSSLKSKNNKIQQLVQQKEQSKRSESSSAQKSVYDIDESDQYGAIAKYEAQKYQKEQVQAQLKQKQDQLAIRAHLDKFKESKEVKKKQDIKIEQQFHQQTLDLTAKLLLKEQEKVQIMQAKIQEEMIHRELKKVEDKKRLKQEKKQERENHEKDIGILNARHQIEDEKQLKRKIMEKDNMMELIKTNEFEQAKLLSVGKKEKQKDLLVMKEYSLIERNKLDRKQNEIDMRNEKIIQVAKGLVPSKPKDLKQIIKEEDEKLHEQMMKKNQREEKAEILKQQETLRIQKDQAQFQINQNKEKQYKFYIDRQMKIQEKNQGEQLADMVKKKALEGVEAEKQKALEKQEILKQNQAKILQQIEQEKLKVKVNMHPEEIKQNQAKLKEIAKDQGLNLKKK